MGKKIEQSPALPMEKIEEDSQPENETGKSALHKFLPHHKYVDVRTKIIKKRLSESIKNISLDKFQIKKAVEALNKFTNDHRDPTDLTDKQDYVYLTIQVSKIPEQHSVRPIQIKLPHPIYSTEIRSRYSVIVSDQSEDKFVETVDGLDAPMLKDIFSYNKIRKEFSSLKDKRQLLAANDLFFCDWKIYNLLRRPLGKLFYEHKKYPFPISCDGEVPEHLKEEFASYQEYLNGLASYTYTMMGNGPVYTIKVCKVNMPVREQVKNIMHSTYSLISNLTGQSLKPKHIRQVSIKTYNSPILPFYSSLLPEEIASLKK